MMLEHGERQLYFALQTAKQFEPDNVIQGGIELSELCTPLKVGINIDIFPKTMNIIRGFREREMTIILAPTGIGKTTVCKEIGYALVKQGCKVGHVFLEEDLKKTQQSYLALDNSVHLPMFREDPTIIPMEAIQDSYDRLINTPRTMWMQHFGSLTPASLLGKFEWMAIKGMEFIILDHISMVFSGSTNMDERKEIDLLLTELAAFTTKTGVHPIIVSHVKRVNKTPRRDKDGSISYPYWDEVDSTQARGSGSFEQLSWNVLGIEPEMLEDKTRGRIRLRVLKNREWGTLAIGDTLVMSKQTGRLIPAGEDEY
jgi:twinkle protein